MSNVPTVEIDEDMKAALVLDIIAQTGIVPSKKEGRRLIEQGGLTINDIKIEDVNETFNESYLEKDGYALIKRGKKKFYKLVIA